MTSPLYDTLQLITPQLQDSVNGKAFMEIFHYWFYGDAAKKSALSLSDAIAVYDSIEKEYLYTQIQNETIDEFTCDMLAAMWDLKGYKYCGQFYVAFGIPLINLKRAFIKNAFLLKRSEGTAYSIDKVLTLIGYTDVVVTENFEVYAIYNGQFQYDGRIDYSGSTKYQLFSVELTSNHIVSETDLTEQESIIAVINAYKKYRPELCKVIIKDSAYPTGRTVYVWCPEPTTVYLTDESGAYLTDESGNRLTGEI